MDAVFERRRKRALLLGTLGALCARRLGSLRDSKPDLRTGAESEQRLYRS